MNGYAYVAMGDNVSLSSLISNESFLYFLNFCFLLFHVHFCNFSLRFHFVDMVRSLVLGLLYVLFVLLLTSLTAFSFLQWHIE